MVFIKLEKQGLLEIYINNVDRKFLFDMIEIFEPIKLIEINQDIKKINNVNEIDFPFLAFPCSSQIHEFI